MMLMVLMMVGLTSGCTICDLPLWPDQPYCERPLATEVWWPWTAVGGWGDCRLMTRTKNRWNKNFRLAGPKRVIWNTSPSWFCPQSFKTYCLHSKEQCCCTTKEAKTTLLNTTYVNCLWVTSKSHVGVRCQILNRFYQAWANQRNSCDLLWGLWLLHST